MRAFFALEIDPEIQYAIEKWRDRTMLPAGRAVSAANFHITLHFLGSIAPRQLERLCTEAGQINAPANGSTFALRLDTPGYFPKPGIFWIGPGDILAPLTALAGSLRKAAKKAGIDTPHKGARKGTRKMFTPHLTLFRNCRTRPPLPTRAPDFDIPCDGFALFESITGHKGVRYQLVRRWPLK